MGSKRPTIWPLLLLLGLAATPARGQLQASFVADVTSGTNPLTVQFQDTSSGAPLVYIWTFGDGASSGQKNPQHTYTTPGTYTVSLQITGSGFQFDTVVEEDLIVVHPAVLETSFSASPASGPLPLQVQFSDTSSGPVDAWTWDLGDGTVSTEQHPVHTYTDPGSYTVTLTTASGGQAGPTTTVADLITVEPVPISLGVSASLTQIAQLWEVEFTSTVVGPEPDSYHWDFGDGATSFLEHPAHTFVPQEAGSLDVSLTVTYLGQEETLVVSDLIDTAPGEFGRAERLIEGFIKDVHVADLDGNGGLDVVTAGAGVAWVPNLDGQGHFGEPEYLLPVTSQYETVTTGDMDGDGRLDVLTARVFGQFAYLRVLLAEGAPGSFAQPLHLPEIDFASHLAVADLDLDGDLDVVRIRNQDSVWAHANDGTAQLSLLTEVSTETLDDFFRVFAHDLDGDGDPDLVAGGTTVTATFHNTDGLGSTWLGTSTGAYSTFIDVTDMDGDGDVDVVHSGSQSSEASPSWLANDGTGSFGPPQLIPHADGGGHRLAAGDIDGDGDGDLLSGNGPLPDDRPYAPVVWFEQDAGWSPHRPVGTAVPFSAYLRLADLDGDGRLDALSSDGQTGVVWQPYRTLVSWPATTGAGVFGSAGVPTLQGLGALTPGETVTLALSQVVPNGSLFLVLGLTLLEAPFKGGVLVPHPDLLLPLQVESHGMRVLQATWPLGVPPGALVAAQAWVLDASGALGFAASEAVTGLSGS